VILSPAYGEGLREAVPSMAYACPSTATFTAAIACSSKQAFRPSADPGAREERISIGE
jgi:hypothetical protein